jgi:hypothetical protein
LCKKLRYYRIGRFRKRLLTAPVVPPIAPLILPPRAVTDTVSESSVENNLGRSSKPRPAKKAVPARPTVREGTIEDIDRIDELTLEDFDVDWSKVQIPQKAEGERMTEREMHVAVESFLDSLRER